MSDIFISYSRRDSEFVKRLHASLVAQKRDVWVDFEDIPLSADWWEEISNNIESADTFIFVISPDSLGSPICNFELAHAAELNKRLIPIVRVLTDEKTMFDALSQRELDENMKKTLATREMNTLARQNWQAISRHNWLFFADDAQFDETFAKLITVIDTDLEHVHRHTRLLVKAKEWESRGKTPDYMLNSGEISEYSAWVRASATKDPRPTELQLEYLFVSQRAANRRQAMLSIGIMVGLVVTGILIAFAYVQNQRIQEGQQTQQAIANDAIAQRGTSDAQAIILTEQRITVEANQIVLTEQVATNIARQTSVAQDQVDKLQTAQAGFIALTQQANEKGTATAVNATLDSLVIENAEVVATLNAFEILATRLSIPTANPTFIFDQAGTQVASAFFTQDARDNQNLDQGDSPTETVAGWSGTNTALAIAVVPTQTSTATATATATPSLTPSATQSPPPTPMPQEVLTSGVYFVESNMGNDANDCRQERNACKTIAGALAKASENATINISYGIYNENVTINQSVTLRGFERDLTILNGAGNGTIVRVEENALLRLDNITISGGMSAETGGGILNFGQLITQNVAITGNTATSNGGGLANFGRAILLNTVVDNNFGANGGGVYNGYGAFYYSDNQTSNSNNTASNSFGSNDVYGEPCPPIVSATFAQAVDICQNLGLGQACYVSPQAQIVPVVGSNEQIFNPGDVVNLTDVNSFNMDWAQANTRASILFNASLSEINGNQVTNFLLLSSDPVPLTNQAIQAGMQVVVDTSFDSPLNIRNAPTITGDIVSAVYTGAVLTVLDGPRVADGYSWWEVRAANGVRGWAVDNADNLNTLKTISPLGEIGLGGTYTVYGAGARGLNLREQPNVASKMITTITQGRDVTIIDGPVDADGYRWWKVITSYSNESGWVVDYADNADTLIPIVRSRVGLPQVYYYNDAICNIVVQNPLRILTGSSVQRIGIVSDWE